MFFAPQDNNKYRIRCFSRSVSQFSSAKEKRGTLLLTPRTRIFPASRELAPSRNMADPRAAVVQFPQQAQNPPVPAQVQQAQNPPAPVQVQRAWNPPAPVQVQQGQTQGQALGNLALSTEQKLEIKFFIYVSVFLSLYFSSPRASIPNCWL